MAHLNRTYVRIRRIEPVSPANLDLLNRSMSGVRARDRLGSPGANSRGADGSYLQSFYCKLIAARRKRKEESSLDRTPPEDWAAAYCKHVCSMSQGWLIRLTPMNLYGLFGP